MRTAIFFDTETTGFPLFSEPSNDPDPYDTLDKIRRGEK